MRRPANTSACLSCLAAAQYQSFANVIAAVTRIPHTKHRDIASLTTAQLQGCPALTSIASTNRHLHQSCGQRRESECDPARTYNAARRASALSSRASLSCERNPVLPLAPPPPRGGLTSPPTSGPQSAQDYHCRSDDFRRASWICCS